MFYMQLANDREKEILTFYLSIMVDYGESKRCLVFMYSWLSA